MPLVSGVCRKASAPKLSHGGSRLNASKPEANPKTRSPTHTLITKNLSSTLYNPSTAATPHTRSQRGEGALDFPNFCNSSDRFCAITRRKGRKPFIIQPKAITQYQLTSVFLTVHSARVFLFTGGSTLRELELRNHKTLSNRHLQKGGALPRIGAKYIHDHKTYPKCNSKSTLWHLEKHGDREARIISE